MDIHKPKAAHSLREFLIEIGTIICGILIALSLEQGVEWLHWRHIVSEARESLDFDLKRGLGWSGLMEAEGPCVARRLSELAVALEQAEQTGRLPPVAWIGNPTGSSWVMRSWSAIESSQAIVHMRVREQQRLSAIERTHETLFQWREDQDHLWTILSTMTGTGRPTNAQEIAKLRQTLAQAAQRARLMRGAGGRLATLIVQTGMLSPSEVDAAFSQGVADAARTSLCRPRQRVATFGDLLQLGLTLPPLKPGEFKLEDVGVRKAEEAGR